MNSLAICIAALVQLSVCEVASLSWEQAYAKAQQTLSQMTRAEKNSMLISRQDVSKGWFVGNINDIPRLKIPSLNMQDNGQGFRTTEDYMIGTVTCWPSALALGASWDTQLVHDVAVAIGQEFATKGANVILGPGIFVHRVARGGRNFESLSGEDPYLGSRLGSEWVEGVQSQGVVATLKHFVFNSQENNRETYNSVVDNHTAWNHYYVPFQAAVDAGAGAVMCSYNLVDGVHSCSNSRRLKDDLKGKMGFKGFVMSDWGAEHGTSISNGEDMDMVNGPTHWWDKWKFHADSVPEPDVNNAVTRTLASIYKMRLDTTTKCVGGSCDEPLHADAQKDHHDLARQAAMKSIVLLKNDNAILPLTRSKVKTIKVLGKAASSGTAHPGDIDWTAADLYSGGGSGHVIPGYHVSPLDGIAQRAQAAGITVLNESSNADADLVIVVGGATSHEANDRDGLHLDDGADDLISSLVGEIPVIALLEVPGAVLMPWADDVDAIAMLFLGGQETGNAWASVLFGDYAPTGHLPISIPKTENDTIAPSSGTIAYSEGMATGYRAISMNYTFPFGHGLTYSTFVYGDAKARPCGQNFCVSLSLRNAGEVAAATVPQLYLEFPQEAQFPTPVLRNFKKTDEIDPGAAIEVTFLLTDQDLSYWIAGSWRKASFAICHIGASSRDIRSTFKLELRGRVVDAPVVV